MLCSYNSQLSIAFQYYGEMSNEMQSNEELSIDEEASSSDLDEEVEDEELEDQARFADWVCSDIDSVCNESEETDQDWN